MSWSPASSDNDSSTSSGDDNEPLTIQDIEKWHSRTTAMNTHSSFNTDTSTLENTVGEDEEQNTITKGASGETITEGSVGSSAAGSADGDYHASFDTNHADDNNRPSRHVVAGLAWTDNDGYEGMYTGEVNEDNVPDGLGLIRYGDGGGEQEGEWRDGTLIRKKGVASTNVIQLSTIEEENVKASCTTSASSMKYTEEFANFLKAKQIGIEDDTLRSSSNSMDAKTTGENSNARDFADSTSTRQSNLYSSTSSRQSHLYYERQNSRRSSLYSSTNSRQLNSSTNSRQDHHRYQKQPSGITKRKTGESTTHEGSDSESDHNSISSGDNFRDSQQHHHEDLELVAEENEEDEEEEVAPDSSRKSSSGRSNSDDIRNDYDDENENNEQDQRPSKKKVPHEAVDAIQKLMANDSNVEYDTDESSNGEHEEDDSSALFDWHEKDTYKHMRASTNSFYPGVVDDTDDDEMGPSMGDHLRDGRGSEEAEEQKSRCFYCPGHHFKRSRRWWYIFSACCMLFIAAIALVSWGITRMQTNNTPSDTNTNVPNSQSKEDDGAGAKISLSWESDAACAPVTIDLVTDQYGNETTWVLYRLAEVHKDTKMSTATRASEFEVGHRKLLRPVASPESKRKMEETTNGASQVIKSGGPYTYMSDTEGNSTSPVYASSVCLPEGNYNLVVSDENGFCCQYGLGHYSVYFTGGRTVRDAPGLFIGEDMTPFEVTSDDILAALATASPSQSLGPSTYIPPTASMSPTIVPEDSLVPPSTQPTVVFKNSSVSLNLAPQSRQPTPSTTLSPQPTLSKPTETTFQPSILSLPVTASPTLSLTIAPSAPSDPPMSASLSPTPRITNITTTDPTLQTSPPSTNSTPLPSQLPSSSPSEILVSIPPTTSGNPTATSSPSTNPTNFNPLLDIELLDSLSIPYKLSHMLSGESHTATTSRRLQAKSDDSLYGFSTAVSADMSVLAVGATNAMDDYGNHTGAVYLYTIDTSVADSIPTLVQVLYGLIPEGEFGNDVKLSDDGNRLVVAARSENEQEGAIRIYDRYPETDEWYVIRTIVGAGAGFRAGWSVDISGDGNVVAMGSTKGSLNEGGMVITYIAPDWKLHGSIIEAQTPRDVMGFSVALNGDGSVVAVGSVKASNPDRVTNAGRAEVYAFNGTSWISQFEVFGETKQAYVGSSVALSGDGNLFVVGGRGFTNDGENSPALGRCRIFERGESGSYELLSEIIGTNSREELGWSASISADGSKVACGGKGGKMLDWGETGVARVWDRSSLVESELLPRGGERFSSVKGANFGSSVSLSSDGSSLVVGASTASAAGAVQVFGIGTPSSISPVAAPTVASVSSAPTTEIVSPPTTGNQLSIVPSASAPPSAPPTIFDPILDIELLDSLSSPYSMTRFTEGKSADSLYGFSTAVSADMSVLAVGATNAIDEYGNHTGAVYLYSVDTSDAKSIPTLVQVLHGSNPDSEFGNDVKLSNDGNRLVVAARSENEQEGAIRIYNRPPRSELWELSHTIVGAGAGFRAGWSVDISGDGNVVAMGSTKAGANEGGIVSTYIAPDWTLHGSIIEAQTPRDVLGFSVALNGDGTVVAVGGVKASNPDRVTNAGRAEVFAFNGTSWISQFEVFGETKQAYVGSSVALSRDGNLFVVGGRGFTNDGENSPALGRCRIFERGESGSYELLSEIIGTNSREELGWSASISADGSKVACGGKGGKMLDWGETGVARVWDRSSLVESEVLPRGGERFSSVKGSSFGSSVSLSSDGSSLVVGASTLAGTNITSPGGVYSFSLS